MLWHIFAGRVIPYGGCLKVFDNGIFLFIKNFEIILSVQNGKLQTCANTGDSTLLLKSTCRISFLNLTIFVIISTWQSNKRQNISIPVDSTVFVRYYFMLLMQGLLVPEILPFLIWSESWGYFSWKSDIRQVVPPPRASQDPPVIYVLM